MSVRECQGAGGSTREARGSAAIDGSHGACGRVWLWSEGRGGRVLPRNRDPRAAKGACQLAGTYWVRLRPSGDAVTVLWQAGHPCAHGFAYAFLAAFLRCAF